MLLDIIFMHKKREGIIVKDLRGLEEILSANESIKYKRIESNNKNILRMRIETVSHNNNKSEAQTLEEIKKKIRESEHRVNYYINICYDGAAEYYCNKLMIPLAIFERNLRQFLYLILISLYDIEWADEFISKEVIDDIKKKNNNNINKLIEKGLEYFTFQNYINCLFIARNLKSIEEMIKEVNNENEKDGVTKEDIVKIINNNAEKTIWEVIFNEINDIKIEFSREDIDNIRKIRNEVVHNKEMTSQKYEKYKKIINKSNKKIKMVITKIEEEKYREKIFDIKPILDMYLNKFKGISDIISSTFKTNIKLEKMIKPITYISNNEFKLYSPIIQSPFEKIIKKIENTMPKIDPMNKLVNTIYQVNPMNKLVNITNQMKLMNKLFTQENFSIIGEEEEKKENKNDYENDNN